MESKSISLKDRGVIGRSDVYKIDPRRIKIRAGWNPRTDFALEDIKDSIRENGVLMPIRVRSKGADGFELVDGERRLRAVLALMDEGCDFVSVPALMDNTRLPDAELMVSTIVTNQGKPFTPLEECEAYSRLLNWGWTVEMVAKRVGRSPKHIRNRLQLREAEPALVQELKNGVVTVSEVVAVVKEADKTGTPQAEVLHQRKTLGAVRKQAEAKRKAADERFSPLERQVFKLLDAAGLPAILRAVQHWCTLENEQDAAAALEKIVADVTTPAVNA